MRLKEQCLKSCSLFLQVENMRILDQDEKSPPLPLPHHHHYHEDEG